MLDPCTPCVCIGAPCEQCSFGYRSPKTNHESMKQLLFEYRAGKRPPGWANAKTYVEFHPDWEKELGLEESMAIHKETICSNCIHNAVCAKKDVVLEAQSKLIGLCTESWLKPSIICDYFRQDVPTTR